AIGDADHGINMARGFGKVMEKLPTVTDKDIGNILKTVGMTLISTVGGASGPLYGTFFTRAAAETASKEVLSNAELVALLKAGVDGIVQRGRPQLGDKTMYDVWAPVLQSLQTSLDAGKETVEMMKTAVSVAEQAVKNTIPLQAKKGRASYLGERSIGHQDPGATSAALLLAALRDAVKG
ncbi:MAG: dihydroxyacetone kinase subunit L, partial [Anaerolineae bacterium]|nr:dihydroxyacetone kinase subunit L [Anaerolineae bacterium]